MIGDCVGGFMGYLIFLGVGSAGSNGIGEDIPLFDVYLNLGLGRRLLLGGWKIDACVYSKGMSG